MLLPVKSVSVRLSAGFFYTEEDGGDEKNEEKVLEIKTRESSLKCKQSFLRCSR